jgi:hypothetical protein
MVHSGGALCDSASADGSTLGVDRKTVEMVMKPLICALCVVSAFGGLSAQKPVWQPSPGHTQIPIWSGTAPDPQPVAGPEYAETSGKTFFPAARRQWV